MAWSFLDFCHLGVLSRIAFDHPSGFFASFSKDFFSRGEFLSKNMACRQDYFLFSSCMFGMVILQGGIFISNCSNAQSACKFFLPVSDKDFLGDRDSNNLDYLVFIGYSMLAVYKKGFGGCF